MRWHRVGATSLRPVGLRPRSGNGEPGAPDFEDRVPDPVRDFPFRATGNGLAPAVPGEQEDLVLRRIEADVGSPDVVHDDQVRALRLHLSAAARFEIFGLGGEGHDGLPLSEGRDLTQKISAGCEK